MKRTLAQWLDYQQSVHPKTIDMGLERVREVGGFRTGYEGAQDWDLVTRIAERTAPANIRHVPHILYHWRAAPGSTALSIGEKNYASAAQYRTLTTHFERIGQRVEITPIAGLCWRVRYPLPQPLPLVTIIIPTRDCGALLRRCSVSEPSIAFSATSSACHWAASMAARSSARSQRALRSVASRILDGRGAVPSLFLPTAVDSEASPSMLISSLAKFTARLY